MLLQQVWMQVDQSLLVPIEGLLQLVNWHDEEDSEKIKVQVFQGMLLMVSIEGQALWHSEMVVRTRNVFISMKLIIINISLEGKHLGSSRELTN